ncbi:hypothetical protein [Mycobacterium branderi]|uniref:DUF2510 domain-containing protein n=1 Tax=Mycobacterium branderi TaxID=43348 RepID=A0A7I7WBZ2_9MYCO|nr:hypothetical protein [Mycobacterium branderi]MCV7236230.1 hypothetical protein [Mycobacterium branderi]ORA35415.1 hypothetical protein BST20_17600 [Mycobacterium branderi]BBZ15109.1 hypothetical protein MBRA_53040 [Mycobacterium branderi]
MPWYPGSDGISTGFWDGQGWLASLTADHLILAGRPIPLDDIVEVAYWNHTIVAVPGPTNNHTGGIYVYRGFSVTDVTGQTSALDLDNPTRTNVPENEVAWQGLAGISQRFIEPRIAQRILATLRAGQEYSIKDGRCFLTLSRDGFTARFLRTKTYPWSGFDGVEINPVFNNLTVLSGKHGQARVWARSAPNRKTHIVTGLETTTPNAVVLSTLMPMCAAAFGVRVV